VYNVPDGNIFIMGKIISKSAADTFNFGLQYAKSLKPNDVVLLNGEMGAGKTVFSKGVAKGLGIDDEVLSPTYAYMNDYSGILYHFDCYRLSSGSQAEGLGLTDYFYAGGICLIEWAENISSVLPEKVKNVYIKKISEGEREIIYE
jgi:tRNA threonylcarbamoyladenosine biosynthesis protein TsaE